jgi:predicted DNA-binding transcriptional regulator AlpA
VFIYRPVGWLSSEIEKAIKAREFITL